MKKFLLTLVLVLSAITTWAYDAYIDGIYYNVNGSTKEATVTNNGESYYTPYSGDIVIPETITFKNTILNVTNIADGAFHYGYEITSITIPNSVTNIGEYAFEYCTRLTTITIPNSVSIIEDGVFSDCYNLTSVIIPNSVTSIGNYTFRECSGLTSVIIPNSVTSIGNGAFSGCTSLTSLSISNSITSIGDYAFLNCSGLTSVTIPNSVTSIGNYAFYGCSGLTSINIPNSVICIGSESFEYCSGLTSIMIGNSVTNIGKQAFSSCQNLAEVTCAATNVPSTETGIFFSSYIDFATLIVPEASLEAYKSTIPWSSFGTFKTLEGGETPEPQKCEKPTIAYENKHLIYSTTTEGAEIVSTVAVADSKTSYANDVELTATYSITAYATKSGLDDSDVATATLVWATASLETEGINEVKNYSVDALPLLISQDNGLVSVGGLNEGDIITAYTADGKEATKAQVSGSSALLNLSGLQGKIAILTVNGKSAKIMIK